MSFLYDRRGMRKYLTTSERRMFLRAARRSTPEVETFCLVLAFTGARISEVLALSAESFDFDEKMVVIENMKKRRTGTFRAIPVPDSVLNSVEAVHGIRCKQGVQAGRDRVWPWCRTAAWSRVKTMMLAAGIRGPHAMPKGLRHAFAVSALQNGLPLNLVRKWLGHSRLSTTEIYADAVGDEERVIARRHWDAFQ